jgi:hypothetical protein
MVVKTPEDKYEFITRRTYGGQAPIFIKKLGGDNIQPVQRKENGSSFSYFLELPDGNLELLGKFVKIKHDDHVFINTKDHWTGLWDVSKLTLDDGKVIYSIDQNGRNVKVDRKESQTKGIFEYSMEPDGIRILLGTKDERPKKKSSGTQKISSMPVTEAAGHLASWNLLGY